MVLIGPVLGLRWVKIRGLDWASGITLGQDSESLGLDLRQEGVGVIPVLVGSVLR